MKQNKKKYPLIAFRLKQQQYDYIRREADEHGLSIAEYARAILIPFQLPTIIKNVDKVVTNS